MTDSVDGEKFVAADQDTDQGREGRLIRGFGAHRPPPVAIGDQELFRLGLFMGVGCPTQYLTIHPPDSVRGIPAVRQNPGGELGRLGMDEGIIEKEQSLGGDRGGPSCRGAGIGVRPIKQREKWVALDALGHQVDAALMVVIDGTEWTMLSEAPAGRNREWVLPTGCRIKFATHLQNGIPYFLGTEAAAGKWGEVVGVLPIGAQPGLPAIPRPAPWSHGTVVGWSIPGGTAREQFPCPGLPPATLLTIGCTEQNPSMHGLHRPPAAHKLGGKIIQQTGIGRALAANAEVIRGFHQPLTKVVLPDSIDHDPGGQWVGGIGQPRGQFQSSTARGAWRQRPPAECCGEPPRDLAAGPFRITPLLKSGIVGRAIAHGIGQVHWSIHEQALEFTAGCGSLEALRTAGHRGRRGRGDGRHRCLLHPQIVQQKRRQPTAVGPVRFDDNPLETSVFRRIPWARGKLHHIPGHTDRSTDRSRCPVESELEIVPCSRSWQSQGLGRNTDVPGDRIAGEQNFQPGTSRLARSVRIFPQPKSVHPGCSGVIGGHQEIQVHVEGVAALSAADGGQALGQSVGMGAPGHTHTHPAGGMKVLEGTLGLDGNGEAALVPPRGDEHPTTPAGSRSLKFKVAIEIIQRTQHGGGHLNLLLAKPRGQRGHDALQIKFDTTKSGYRSSSLGLIPYTSSTGVEKYTGEFAGSVIRMKHGKNPFDQTEVSQIKNYSQIDLNHLNTVYYVTTSLGALYQNVTESQRSKRFFGLDYTYNKNVPVNFGIVTQSMSSSLVNNYATYTNKNSPYAFVQDYNYYTNAFTVPRYYGSKTQSSLFTYYVQGESGSYGNTAAVDKIKYEYAYLVDIYSSSILMPRRCNAQIKYIIDNNQNVLDLTKANTNIFYTQNIFKSGETVNVSLFDYDQKNPDVRYLTNNSGLGLYEGGFIYFPLMHNLSGSATSFNYNLPEPIAITQTIAGGTVPPTFGAPAESSSINYGNTGIGYQPSTGTNVTSMTFVFQITYTVFGQTISTTGGVVTRVRVPYYPPVGVVSIQASGLQNFTSNVIIGGQRYIEFDAPISQLLNVTNFGYGAGNGNVTVIVSPPNSISTSSPGIFANGTVISVVPSPTGSTVTNPQNVTTYVNSVSDPQTCLYYQTSSYSIVMSNTIARYYGSNFIFDSNSDPAFSSSLFQPVNTPFSLNVGDQIHFYTSSLGWSEKEEYVIATAYISGAGDYMRLYATLNRPLNTALLSTTTVDSATNSNLKACRYIVLKHVPDETNLILRYNPTTNILQDGLVFPQYIDQTVKDQSGNTIKSLKSQNLI